MSDESDVPAVVDTVMEQVGDFTVVASNPAEMQAAQNSLILWAARQIIAEKELLKEAEEQYEIAHKNKWRYGGWARRISLSKDKIEYFRKIKIALEAGYYIVPPFPIDVFAVRTVKKKPTTKMGWTNYETARKQGIPHDALPSGEGEYVANEVQTKTFTKELISAAGTKQTQTYHYPYKFSPVEFPFKLAKAAVMSQTAKAMALKVFDQLGIMGTSARTVQAAVPDPIVCGQILPWHHKRQAVTFFVAWWLDTKTL